MPQATRNWLVSTDWLADHLEAPDVKILDASYRPAAGVPLDVHYQAEHIPGAQFFNIDEIADTDNPLPHMLPSPEKFVSRMRKMGIGDGDRVVVYDDAGLYSAARAWWMFRVMGHDDVAVLDGGLPKWKAEGRPLEHEPPQPAQPKHFTARMQGDLVRDVDDMRRISDEGGAQIVDARSSERFHGTAPEPRPTGRAGHIPGSLNLPYAAVLNEDGTMRTPEQICQLFDMARVDLNKPIVTTCGSGVTACILSLGLATAGYERSAVYDGSWTEWSARPELPVAPEDDRES
ncbi:MAG: 3-mercaptopyruvate sulfurtransferase [Dichotomicrobium sp.]